MTGYCLAVGRRWLGWMLAGGLVALAGCQPIDCYDQSLELGVPPEVLGMTGTGDGGAAIGGPGSARVSSVLPSKVPPRELAKMSLPAYRIEPPDVVQIELVKLVPLPPYRVEVYDVLQVVVAGTLLDQPIDGPYMVNGEGKVHLGPAYGSVRIAGMTIDEATAAIDAHLRQILKRPEVSLQLLEATGLVPVGGSYLVGPDGTVNLRSYGSVHVAGKTLLEAKQAIEAQLAQFLDSPVVWVDVEMYMSKVYYVITEGAGMGDNVTSIPITGNETVLDAISQIQGLSQLSSKNIWIARPAPGGFACEQHLPVDWDAITRGASTVTNYQVLPGDRIFIAEDETVALANFIAKLTSPVEQLMGFTTLTFSTIRSGQTLGRGYNQSRGGGW